MKRNHKAGFSLMEAVIAMAVVVIVSIAATTAMLGAVNIKATTIQQTTAQNFAANALEGFQALTGGEMEKVSEADSYSGYLYFLTGQGCQGTETAENSNIYRYVYSETGWTAVIEINYNTRTFHIDVTGKNETNIVTLDYRKGGYNA